MKQHRFYFKRTIMLLAVSISIAGCKKDLLDKEPFDAVSSASMWTTDNLTDLGVTGVYQTLRLGTQNSGPSQRELYQMDALGFTSMYRGGNEMTNGTSTTSSGRFADTWKELYEGVARSNDAILNIAARSPSAPQKKARYIAECKFLRAYFYYRLNQLYKGVPVYLEPVPVAGFTKPRETEEKVWELVLTDLTDAINETNLPNKYAKSNAQYGHVTKGAAYALRGKVYLYLKKWDLAAADFSKVKEAGYSIFMGSGPGSATYKALFKESNEQSDEMIFSIQNIGVDGFGSTTQWYLGTRSAFGSNWNNYYINPALVDLYEHVDGSKFNWDEVIPGYNAMPVSKREVYFLRNNLSADDVAAFTKKGLDMSLYLPAGNEQRIQAAYANRDPRLSATVIVPYSTFLGRAPFAGAGDQVYTSRWPSKNDQPPMLDLFTDSRDQFYYLHRKFVYEGSNETLNRQFGPIDFPIIRYADVLLMWAEALNEQGLTADAVAKVNEVRARAGIAALNSSSVTMVDGQTDLRIRIQNERRIELAGEGVNYFDELRWGTLKAKVFFTGSGVNQVWGSSTVPYVWKDNVTIWPIPQTETEMNPNLKQQSVW